MKSFQCSDVVQGCDWQVQGNTEEEIMAKAAEHGKEKHGFTHLTDEMKAKVRSLIRDIKAA